MRLLIKNGRFLNPATNTDEITDLLIEDNVVLRNEKENNELAHQEIDATDYFVMTVLIDVHFHLIEPGF